MVDAQLTAGSISPELSNRIKNVLKQTETSVDGEFVMNRVNLEQNIAGWQRTVNNVRNDMALHRTRQY
jgi:hypothetical protein